MGADGVTAATTSAACDDELMLIVTVACPSPGMLTEPGATPVMTAAAGLAPAMSVAMPSTTVVMSLDLQRVVFNDSLRARVISRSRGLHHGKSGVTSRDGRRRRHVGSVSLYDG